MNPSTLPDKVARFYELLEDLPYSVHLLVISEKTVVGIIMR